MFFFFFLLHCFYLLVETSDGATRSGKRRRDSFFQPWLRARVESLLPLIWDSTWGHFETWVILIFPTWPAPAGGPRVEGSSMSRSLFVSPEKSISNWSTKMVLPFLMSSFDPQFANVWHHECSFLPFACVDACDTPHKTWSQSQGSPQDTQCWENTIILLRKYRIPNAEKIQSLCWGNTVILIVLRKYGTPNSEEI